MEIDFRSDTLTASNDEMRKAMATAVVGDDVFGEDPTVTQFERLVQDVLPVYRCDALHMQRPRVRFLLRTVKGESGIIL